MIWENLKELIVFNFTGSYLLTGLFFLVIIISLLFLIKANKDVIVGITAIYVYFLSLSGIFPSWLFFISVIIIGLSIGNTLIKLFYGGK